MTDETGVVGGEIFDNKIYFRVSGSGPAIEII